MTEESAYPCPVCHTLTSLAHPCPGCGRAPDPNAAAVITLDHRITDLRTRADQAKRDWDGLTWQLGELRREREAFATAVRSSVAKERSISSSSLPTVVAGYPTAPVAAPPTARPEAAPRTVQNLLFILGGLLLGTAALVFTAVAWDVYGVVGRAVILSAVTAATLTVPPLVRRRGLNATAETFAALGLFLIPLDGYAAWFVNLAGIQDSWDGSFYAGTISAITAIVAFGYSRLVKLTGPRFIALAAVQPILPLYFVESAADAEIWALVITGVAVLNAIFIWRGLRPVFLTVLGWLFHGLAVLIGFGIALSRWVVVGDVRTSAVLVTSTLAFALGAWAGRQAVHRAIAAGVVVFTVVAAVVRPTTEYLVPERQFVVWSAAAALAVLVCWLIVRGRPNPWSIGARWGATVALLVPVVIALVWAGVYAVANVVAAAPWWHADDAPARTGPYLWELPVALVLLVGAGALLAPGLTRKAAVIAGLVALAFAAPGWPPAAPWIAPAADLLVATGLLVWALTVPGRAGLIFKSIGALALVGHAVLAAQGSPMGAMITMTAVVALGLFVSTVAPRSLLRPGVTIDGRHELAGVSAGLVDLLLPLLAFTSVAAFGGDRVTSWRVMVLVVLAVPLLGTGRGFRGYHVVAGIIVALYPLWPDLPGGESPAIYAALSVVAMTLVALRCVWGWVRWAPLLPGVVALVWTAPSWSSVLIDPINNLSNIWSGNPPIPQATMPHAIALTLLMAPLARTRSWRVIGLVAVIPALVWLAVLDVRWPVIPAVTLLGGLTILMVAALKGKHLVLGLVGAVLVIPGVAGALPEQWSTIAALAITTVALVVTALGAKDRDVRILSWLAGAAAKASLAFAIGRAADLRPEITAYLVLLVAAILIGAAYTPWLKQTGRVVEGAAHAVALVALGLANGEPRYQAGVLAIWGVAIGLTALHKQAVARATLAAVLEAVAWIVLLTDRKVDTLEAYTLPIAVLAIAVGVLAARRHRELSSWVAYGPALAAALLPSLGAVLLESGNVNRRLLLGAGALLVVVVGAIWRKKAPFMLGGAVLLVLAIHELALVWQKAPAWIPLTVGGLLLVGIAITYERRLRDLGRLRDAVSRMS